MKKCEMYHEQENMLPPACLFRFWCSPQNFRAFRRVGRTWQWQPDQTFGEGDCNTTSSSPETDECKSYGTFSTLHADKYWEWLCKSTLQVNSSYLHNLDILFHPFFLPWLGNEGGRCNQYLGSINSLHKESLYHSTLAFAWLVLAQVFVTAGQSASNT